MRVLHGPVNIGNQPWVLSRHERALGVDSDLVINYGTWLHYPADRILSEPGRRNPLHLWRRFWFGASAPFRYEVMHYYFGRTFLSWEDFPRRAVFRNLDLWLARRLGRKVFMTLQGCDARLSDESERRNPITMCNKGKCGSVDVCRNGLDAERRRMIQTILPRCDRVFYYNPELGHYVPDGIFLPYPVEIETLEPTPPSLEGPIKIVHAPTDSGIKGTPRILEALATLKKRWPIETILVQKLPHAEAMKLYREADLVIDQLYAGWYGAFAVEAMALGKPVACYLRGADFDCLPGAMRRELPLIQVQPDSLERDLEEALARRQEWHEWSRRGRDFVNRWHNPSLIARAMVRAYRDPQSRFVLDPDDRSLLPHRAKPCPLAA